MVKNSNGHVQGSHEHREDAPIMSHKHYEASSIFKPESLLREARRQEGLVEGTVPGICILDPDGDLVDYLQITGHLQHDSTWACYHTVLHTFVYQEITYGIIGRVVGAPFAVLVAEECEGQTGLAVAHDGSAEANALGGETLHGLVDRLVDPDAAVIEPHNAQVVVERHSLLVMLQPVAHQVVLRVAERLQGREQVRGGGRA